MYSHFFSKYFLTALDCFWVLQLLVFPLCSFERRKIKRLKKKECLEKKKPNGFCSQPTCRRSWSLLVLILLNVCLCMYIHWNKSCPGTTHLAVNQCWNHNTRSAAWLQIMHEICLCLRDSHKYLCVSVQSAGRHISWPTGEFPNYCISLIRQNAA